MKKAAVIGCGYIGQAIIKTLHKKQYIITSITNNLKDAKDVDSYCQKTIILKDGQKEELKSIIENNDIIILTLADKHYTYRDLFLKIANSILETAKKLDQTKTLIYTSRAKIYGEQKGLFVDENSTLYPVTENDEILIETENILLELQKIGWKITILRLAEVYGPSFEISKKIKYGSDYFMPKKENYFTNMIHLKDIVKAIIYTLEHNLTGIYNLADDDHFTQKEILEKFLKKIDLKNINFISTFQTKRGNYRVSNHKIKSEGYNFIYPKRVFD